MYSYTFCAGGGYKIKYQYTQLEIILQNASDLIEFGTIQLFMIFKSLI